MRALISIAGTTGGLLLIIRLIGELVNFSHNKHFLIAGLVLIVGITLPLFIIDRVRQKKKIDKIIRSHKNSQANKKAKIPISDFKTKGWNTNGAPIRERKSGLTWGGGNIKGANATRGTKRSFLK